MRRFNAEKARWDQAASARCGILATLRDRLSAEYGTTDIEAALADAPDINARDVRELLRISDRQAIRLDGHDLKRFIASSDNVIWVREADARDLVSRLDKSLAQGDQCIPRDLLDQYAHGIVCARLTHALPDLPHPRFTQGEGSLMHFRPEIRAAVLKQFRSELAAASAKGLRRADVARIAEGAVRRVLESFKAHWRGPAGVPAQPRDAKPAGSASHRKPVPFEAWGPSTATAPPAPTAGSVGGPASGQAATRTSADAPRPARTQLRHSGGPLLAPEAAHQHARSALIKVLQGHGLNDETVQINAQILTRVINSGLRKSPAGLSTAWIERSVNILIESQRP